MNLVVVHEPEELLEKAWWYAEEMVQICRDRKEVEKFEGKEDA